MQDLIATVLFLIGFGCFFTGFLKVDFTQEVTLENLQKLGQRFTKKEERFIISGFALMVLSGLIGVPSYL